MDGPLQDSYLLDQLSTVSDDLEISVQGFSASTTLQEASIAVSSIESHLNRIKDVIEKLPDCQKEALVTAIEKISTPSESSDQTVGQLIGNLSDQVCRCELLKAELADASPLNKTLSIAQHALTVSGDVASTMADASNIASAVKVAAVIVKRSLSNN